MKIQEIVQKWLDDVALPQINERKTKPVVRLVEVQESYGALGTGLLNQAREILQSLQNEEQIVLNQRMREQEWAAQSTQILDFLTKFERSVIEMQKEKRGYLLTGETSFADAYRRATADFYTYHGYLSILVANAPEQADALNDIKKGVERWTQVSAVPEMEAKRLGKDIPKSNGEELMTDIRERLTKFQLDQVTLYETRSNSATRDRIIKTTALALLCVFAVGLLIVSNSYSFVLVRRQLAKLEGIETRIRSIIENILDGMITVDEQGIICSMNPSAEKMFDCITNEMVGHKFTKLVPKTYG
jgi:PAS domain S-box